MTAAGGPASSAAAPPPAAPLIEIDGLEFRYGGPDGFVLSVPSLRVARGARAAIIGPSGSGKSTLLGLIAGILVPDRGRIAVGGVDRARAGDAARRRFRVTEIGMVFQEFELLDHLTVRENVLLPYFVNAALRLDGAVEARLVELAEAAGIGRYLARRPRELSHGERQRVAICRALVTSPTLLLADEPTGNLDPVTARRVLDLLTREASRAAATLLMVTHDHGLAASFEQVIDFEALDGPTVGAVDAGAARHPGASG